MTDAHPKELRAACAQRRIRTRSFRESRQRRQLDPSPYFFSSIPYLLLWSSLMSPRSRRMPAIHSLATARLGSARLRLNRPATCLPPHCHKVSLGDSDGGGRGAGGGGRGVATCVGHPGRDTSSVANHQFRVLFGLHGLHLISSVRLDVRSNSLGLHRTLTLEPSPRTTQQRAKPSPSRNRNAPRHLIGRPADQPTSRPAP